MFDDHIQKPNNQPGAPGNLPVGEPEDMFSSSEEADVVLPPAAEQPSSAPSEVLGPDPTPGSALQAGVLRPASSVVVAPAATPEPILTQPVTPQPMVFTHESTGKGKIVFLVLIILLLLGGIGWVAYTKFFASSEVTVPFGNTATTPATNVPEPAPEPSEPDTVVPEESDATDPLDSTAIDNSLLFGQPIDTDGDGLDDTREATLGTDEKNWDTDGDELSDGDEVIIWKTNPLNPDSDGDTYKDGAEVRSGYNPAGSGKLFEPPK